MYIAGLRLSMPSPQRVEALAVFTTADLLRHLLCKSDTAKAEGGFPVPDFAPRSLLDKFMFPIQFLPPAMYCTAVVFNNFQQPAWLLRLALPEDLVRPEWQTPVRIAACAAGFSLKFALDRIRSDSGERRRTMEVIQTGPYAVVRHPAYSVILLQQAFYSVMYWSYVPLASLGVLAGVFAVRMPLEEKAAQEDEATGNDYTEYMKRTPARIIPYVW